MIIRTKKYQLTTKTYIGLAFNGVLKQQWWVFGIYLAICAGYFLIPNWWWIIGATIALAVYFLFWLIQFAGVTQLEQGKFLFQRMNYEITSQQILIKLSERQGMPVKWDQIKRVRVGKDFFVLFLSKAQLIHLPYKIFKSENEIKFLKTVLKRKEFIK
ncbi:MAG: YcxB family protein [Cyclobacteriaceae bacterium]